MAYNRDIFTYLLTCSLISELSRVVDCRELSQPLHVNSDILPRSNQHPSPSLSLPKHHHDPVIRLCGLVVCATYILVGDY
jgi:hypothetical protein